MLLDIAHSQLHVEIVDVGLGDLLQPEKDWFQSTQLLNGFDLVVQALQLIQRFQFRCAPTMLSYTLRKPPAQPGGVLKSPRAGAAEFLALLSGRAGPVRAFRFLRSDYCALTIALDATPLTVSTGGIARYTLELARALAAEFPQDQYWLLSDQSLPAPVSYPSNLQNGAQSPDLLAGLPGLLARRWWLFGLNRQMIRRQVEVFHGTDFSVPYLQRRPSVMTLHDLSPWTGGRFAQDPGARRIRRRTPVLLRLGLATMVITPSQAVRSEAIARFRLLPDRVVAVPLAASGMFHRVEGPPAPKPYFLFVGTLEPRKNIARLIEAWREVRKAHDIDLVIAGRVRPDFEAPAPEPGLRLLGAVPDADLPGLYSGALAVVYPSLYEGFGLPVLEAMQCGAIVVTSRDPAVTEVSGGTAIHIDATDVRSLAEALRAIARAPGNFDSLRARALARAAEFTWQSTARRTREVYEAAIRAFRHA